MNPFKTLLDRFTRAPKNQGEWNNNNLPIGSLAMEDFTTLKTLTHYHNDQYENGYADIRAIANRFFPIQPKGIDANGKPMEKTPNALNCLARPNQQTSGVDFRDQLAVMSLVHDKVFILVWQRNGNESIPAQEGVREENISGYTFLEDVQEEVIDGKLRYRVSMGTRQYVFFPYQVMSFFDVNPSDLSKGYSPSRSARRWTRIDDYIADYQTGFFENGAIPAGQFIITAPTKTDYEDIVKHMKRAHGGAKRNNGVMYSYQAIDPVTNKPSQASVTWVPFNVNNRELSLQELFDQANKKVSAAFGVPDFIKGDAEAPNFATAQVIERSFVENKIRPFAIKKWARFQHELNRITGGLNYGITFHLDTPNVADEQESVARTNTLRVTALTTLVAMGYTIDSSINALDLPNNWKQLKKGTSDTTVIENDKEDVDEGEEVEGSPEGLQGAAKRPNPKAHTHSSECKHDPKNLTSSDEIYYRSQIELVAEGLMSKQIEDAITALDGQSNVTDEDEEDFLRDMMAIIAVVLLVEGITQWEAGKMLLMAQGIADPGGSYALTTDAVTRYRTYLKEVFTSYTSETSQSIRTVLERSTAESFTRQETETALRGIMNTDKWRVTRIGVSETNRSSALASIEAMVKMEDESEATIEKTMASKTGAPCEFCSTLIGVWVPVKKTMVKKGDIILGVDGGMFVNNWDNNDGHDLHANGACYPVYRVAS